jgi:hypothetical protein
MAATLTISKICPCNVLQNTSVSSLQKCFFTRFHVLKVLIRDRNNPNFDMRPHSCSEATRYEGEEAATSFRQLSRDISILHGKTCFEEGRRCALLVSLLFLFAGFLKKKTPLWYGRYAYFPCVHAQSGMKLVRNASAGLSFLIEVVK